MWHKIPWFPIKINKSAGVSIQENLNYSPALSVICQILPQLKSCSCFLTRVIDDICFSWWFGGGASQCQMPTWTHRGCLRGDVPPQKLANFVFLKLESCNLMNTLGACLEQAMSKKKKKKTSWTWLTQILHLGRNFGNHFARIIKIIRKYNWVFVCSNG